MLAQSNVCNSSCCLVCSSLSNWLIFVWTTLQLLTVCCVFTEHLLTTARLNRASGNATYMHAWRHKQTSTSLKLRPEDASSTTWSPSTIWSTSCNSRNNWSTWWSTQQHITMLYTFHGSRQLTKLALDFVNWPTLYQQHMKCCTFTRIYVLGILYGLCGYW